MEVTQISDVAVYRGEWVHNKNRWDVLSVYRGEWVHNKNRWDVLSVYRGEWVTVAKGVTMY
jgi:exonuclease I